MNREKVFEPATWLGDAGGWYGLGCVLWLLCLMHRFIGWGVGSHSERASRHLRYMTRYPLFERTSEVLLVLVLDLFFWGGGGGEGRGKWKGGREGEMERWKGGGNEREGRWDGCFV